MTRAAELRMAILVGCGALFLFAQPAAARQDPTTVDELTIVGQRPLTKREAISRFIEETTVKTGTGQIGRWDKEICPSVSGFPQKYNDFIRNRISALAMEVGLIVGQPGCKANLIVVATGNAEELLKDSVKTNKQAFMGDEWTIRPGMRKLKEFIASDDPVRWWFVVKRVTRDGTPYRSGDSIVGRGRIGSAVRADFNHVFVILDVSRIRTVHFPALADYIAMVSLAQTDPTAKYPNVPTILRLFSDREAGLVPVEGVTEWDRAYLKGLYAAKRDAKRSAFQEREMRRSVEEALDSPR